MGVLPGFVEKVIEEFEKLPGVGPKSAARMAYHYMRSPNKEASKLATALTEMDEKKMFCSKCFNVTDKEICDICSSNLRDKSKLCVVEEPLDVVAFEKTGVFNGVYFVLGGVISPADGIGAEELRFPQLKRRVQELIEENSSENRRVKDLKNQLDDILDSNRRNSIGEEQESLSNKSKADLEIVVATNPSLEGEATAAYVGDLLKGFINESKITVTRLAMGLPTGADLEYADRLTLKRALEGRRAI